MRNIRKLMVLLLLMLGAISLAAMGDSGSDSNKVLVLAHNLAKTHPLGEAIQGFADEVKEKTNGEIAINIKANGILGSEKDTIELLRNGTIAFARSGASSIENFSSVFSVFSVPYLFHSRDFFDEVLDNESIMKKVYTAAEKDGIIGLTVFGGGARNFYTRAMPIEKPEDLAGLKIRVINSPTFTQMMNLLGGNPTPIPFGDIYTSLQSGVIDGAENDPTALTLYKHGEVAKFYAKDEHARNADFLIASKETMNALTEEQVKIVRNAAKSAKLQHRELWIAAEEKALEELQTAKYGVKINVPDKAAFRKLVQPMYDAYYKQPLLGDLIKTIESLK